MKKRLILNSKWIGVCFALHVPFCLIYNEQYRTALSIISLALAFVLLLIIDPIKGTGGGCIND